MSDGTNTKGSNSGGNLDITQIPNEDTDQLGQMIEGFYKQDSSVKSRLAYNWDRNHRMLDGDQWLVFDGNRETGGMWNRLTVSKANEYIPRPVTNYLFDGYQTLKAYVLKNKPRSTVRPNDTKSFKDKTAAQLAELVLEANWERLNEQANYEYAAACLITYGTVFKKDFWDTTAVSFSKVPKMQSVPQTDPATGMPTGAEMEIPVTNPETGEQEYELIPLGDVNSEIVEPYRIAMDPLATDLHKAKWIMEYSIQSLDWIREMYEKQDEGYTGRVEEVKQEKELSGAMKQFYELKNSSGVKGQTKGSGTGSSDATDLTNSAVVKEYYERPSQKFPEGRMVVVANGIVLYAGKTRSVGPEQGDWHPYSECRWEIVPGRFHGKSPLDAGCEIQKQINSIDAVVILTRKTMAVPQKLVPNSAGIPDGVWTGRPGQQLNYRDTGGAKPEIIPGVGVDSTVFAEREQKVEDLKNVMGAIDILKGDRPPGVNAASALSLLYEVGTGKLFPVLDRWKKFTENSQKKQLKLVSVYYREPREDFIRILKAKNKELPKSAFEKFLGTDLYDNCNVIIEAGSNIPKLQAAQQSRLMEAAQVGTLGLEMPANRIEFNRQLGIAGFDGDVGPDMKRAQWENDLLDNLHLSPDNVPIRLEVDDDAVHMATHSARMKEPSFIEAPSEVQMAYMAHYTEHMNAQAMKEQSAAMNAQASGQPPAPQQSGADPSQPISRGKGTTAELKNATAQDALPPGMTE